MAGKLGAAAAGLSHLFVTVFLSNFAIIMVFPAMTDVTMAAICPGQDECSLAIYLSGFQQAVRTYLPLVHFIILYYIILYF